MSAAKSQSLAHGSIQPRLDLITRTGSVVWWVLAGLRIAAGQSLVDLAGEVPLEAADYFLVVLPSAVRRAT